MTETATKLGERRDSDMAAARRSADQILNLLQEFIPAHSFRAAWEKVAETSFEHGWEMTSRDMRRQYEAWKSTQIEIAGMMPQMPKISGGEK